MKTNTFKFLLGLLSSLVVLEAFAQSYSVDWQTITGGSGTSAGTMYSATVTIGQAVASAGMSASEPSVGTGFWSLFMGITANPTNPPPGLVLTPATGFVSSGAVGGPFSPDSRAYDLSTSGNASLGFTATASANWFSIFPTFGSVGPGASMTVGVQLTTNAYALPAGNYTGTVSYVTGTGVGNTTLAVTLSVGQGLSISGPLRFDAQGFIGGPVSPGSVTNQLHNGTVAPPTWAAVLRNGAINYVNLSQTGGTLAPGETTTVVAALKDSVFTATSPVSSAGDIWFTNLTSGVGSYSLPFTLSVSHPLVITPADTSFSVGGPEGGPFPSTSQSYVLRNNTGIPQNWTASHADWLNVSPASGTLAPWANTDVTLSISAAATNLLANTYAYSDTVRFFLPAYPQDSAVVSAWLSVFSVPPQVTVHPGHHTVSPGAALTLSVTATGSRPLAYQWLHDGVEIPGATTNTLGFAQVVAADAGHYSVRVSNQHPPTHSADGTVALFSMRSGNPPVVQLSKASADRYRIDYKNTLTNNWKVYTYIPTGYTTAAFPDSLPNASSQRFYRAVYAP